MEGIERHNDKESTVTFDLAAGRLHQANIDTIIARAKCVDTPIVNIVIRNVDVQSIPFLIVDPREAVYLLIRELRQKDYELEVAKERLAKVARTQGGE